MNERLAQMQAARRRADAVARLRSLAQGSVRPPGPGTGVGVGAGTATGVPAGDSVPVERCDICHTIVPDDHRHLLHLEERRIVCACEACWALHSGDAEYRPAGMRTIWLDGLDFDDELWGMFQIPIGLAFFMRSSVTDGVVAFYPSPAGATESELPLEPWDALTVRNPALAELELDAEALVVNRLSDPHQYVIAPIDDCYRLVGLIKSRWEGISGGDALDRAVPEFFAELRARRGALPGAMR